MSHTLARLRLEIIFVQILEWTFSSKVSIFSCYNLGKFQLKSSSFFASLAEDGELSENIQGNWNSRKVRRVNEDVCHRVWKTRNYSMSFALVSAQCSRLFNFASLVGDDKMSFFVFIIISAYFLTLIPILSLSLTGICEYVLC